VLGLRLEWIWNWEAEGRKRCYGLNASKGCWKCVLELELEPHEAGELD
jgi:hypothetical protein